MRRVLPLFLAPVLLGSCLVLGTGRVRDLYVSPGYQPHLRAAPCSLEAVTVDTALDAHRLEQNAAYILRLILARRSSQAAEGTKPLSVRVLIKEEQYLRAYRTLNSVAVELRFFAPESAEPVALLLYSENTEDSIRSYAYLYSLLSRAVGQLR
jgi:hypothetical protein